MLPCAHSSSLPRVAHGLWFLVQPSSAIVTSHNVRVIPEDGRPASVKGKQRRRSLPHVPATTLDAAGESEADEADDAVYDLTDRHELKKLSAAVAGRLAKTQATKKSK